MEFVLPYGEMKHTYNVKPTGTVQALYNELGEIVFSGGLLECGELKGRYEARANLVRGRMPFTGTDPAPAVQVVQSASLETLRTGPGGVVALRLESSHGASKLWGPKFNNDAAGLAMAEEWCGRLIGRGWGG